MSNIFSTSFGINFAKLTPVWLALISLTAKINSLLFLSHPVYTTHYAPQAKYGSCENHIITIHADWLWNRLNTKEHTFRYYTICQPNQTAMWCQIIAEILMPKSLKSDDIFEFIVDKTRNCFMKLLYNYTTCTLKYSNIRLLPWSNIRIYFFQRFPAVVKSHPGPITFGDG